MINIRRTQIDNNKLLDDIISNKNGIRKRHLLSISKIVKERYEFYENNIHSLELIVPEPTRWISYEDDLKSCYDKNINLNVALDTVRKQLPQSIQAHCPYCMINRPNSIDHYFGKKKYPEYSAYIPNLIPCCSECNSNKGEKLFDSQRNRLFIHFYFDEIPQEQFLFFKFEFDSDRVPKIDMSLEFPFEDNPTYSVIKNHFKSLHLFKTYKASINDKLSEILSEIDIQRKNMPVDGIKKILEIRMSTIVKSKGKNFWEACIYDGLLNCELIWE